MVRWLGVLVALGLVAAPAGAQVFKPKGKKADVGDKQPVKKAAKKQPKGKKKVTTKPAKRNAAAQRSKPDDLARDKGDADYVKITDDEDIE